MSGGKAARPAVWAAFLALCAITVDGIFRHGLLKQVVWDPEGLRSLGWYAAAAVASLGALCLFARRFLAPVVAGAAAVFMAAAVGPAALGAAALVLWSAHALGAIWIPRKSALDSLLAVACGLAIFIAAMNVTVRLPVNYPAVWLALVAAPVLAAPRIPLPSWRASLTRGESAAIATLLFLGLIPWLLAVKPEVSADGLAMHLVIPWTIANEHRWHFDVSRFAWSVMPMGGDWLYTIAYLLGGEFAARLLNVGALYLLCGFVFFASRLWLGIVPSALVTAALLSNPLTGLVSTSLFVENIWAVLAAAAFVALWRFHESRDNRFLYAAGLAMGAALATKIGSAAFALVAATIVAIERPRLRAAAAFAALVLGAGAAPYVTAWMRTGNPVFPFANHIFKAAGFDSTAPFVDVRYAKPLTPLSLYDFTFGTSGYYEAQNGAWGFHMLWLIPLTLVLIRRKWSRLAGTALAGAAVYFAIAFSSLANLRYFYPATPLVLIAAAQGIGALPDRALRTAICAALALFTPLNVYFFGSGNWYHREFIALGRQALERYERFGAPSRALVRYLNEKHPGEPAAFFEIRQFGELKGQAYGDTWHSHRFDRAIKAARNARDVIRALNERGVRFAIAPLDLRSRAYLGSPVPLVLDRFAEVEKTNGDAALYRLHERFAGPTGWVAADDAEERRQWLAAAEDAWRRTIASPGRVYDDLAPEIWYRGAWFRDRQFGQAHGGTLVYSEQAGDSASIRIEGTGLSYIHTKAPNRGIAEILVDGKTWGEVDLYAPAAQWRARTEIAGLAAGEHVIEIRVTGRRNRRASGAFVDVDGVEAR